MPNGIFVITNGYVWVNGVDLSDHTTKAGLNYNSETVDATRFGLSSRTKKGGLKDWSLSIDLQQDYAAASVNKTIFPLVGTTACFEVRPVNACSSTNNPSFYGVGTIDTYTPLSGAVGELLMGSINMVASGDLSMASSS